MIRHQRHTLALAAPIDIKPLEPAGLEIIVFTPMCQQALQIAWMLRSRSETRVHQPGHKPRSGPDESAGAVRISHTATITSFRKIPE